MRLSRSPTPGDRDSPLDPLEQWGLLRPPEHGPPTGSSQSPHPRSGDGHNFNGE